MKYAFINGIILDGSADMKARVGEDIIVDGDRIVGVGKGLDTSDAHVIDLGGRYIMPGLINMHVHLAGNGKVQKKQRDNARLVRLITSNALTRAVARKMVSSYAYLELMGGVTTIRTVGGIADLDSKLRDKINSGKAEGPRILAANTGISVPGGHMAGSVAVSAATIEDGIAQIDECKRQGVDLIKLMVTGGVLDAEAKGVPGELKMQPEMIAALCEHAHKLGFKVAAHVESPDGVRAALRGGVDSIEHGATPDDEIISLFKEKGAFLCTTLSPALPYALFDRSISNASEVEQYNGDIVFRGIIDCAKTAIESGIPIALGNDVGCPWITQYDFWRELCYFHKYVGASSAYTLHLATENAAKLAGIGDETGSIEVGKCADMIVTSKDPLEDLSALRRLDYVMARGKLYKSPRPKINKKVESELDKFLK